MKYKLIKTYPGSPQLGTVIYFKHNGFWYADSDREFTAFGCGHVLDYPGFWQPESEWISKLTNSPKGSLHWLNTNMGFVLRVGEAMSNQVQDSNTLHGWGFDVQQIAKEIMEYFKDKLK